MAHVALTEEEEVVRRVKLEDEAEAEGRRVAATRAMTERVEENMMERVE